MASPQLKALIDKIVGDHAPGKPVPEERFSDVQLAQALSLMDALSLPIDDSVTVREAELAGVHGVWLEPDGADSAGTILYFHGGGYMFGSARNTGHVTGRLAAEAGVYAFSVDYRLSWQAPFPAALDDALATYRALLDTGRAPQSIALAGDSAGGGLVLATLIAARDADLPLPAAGFTSSAFTDLAITGETVSEADDPVVSRKGLKMLGNAYLGGIDPQSPLASPLYADLAGLPPLLLQVGGREILLDDTTRFAERAREAGVDVTLEVLDELIHIWQYYGPDLPETRDSEQRAGRFIRSQLSLSEGPRGWRAE